MRTNADARATVAVIGSGAAGAFVVHGLRKTFGDGVRIALFERNDRVGGRVRQVEFTGVLFEAGGSMIHSTNRYMGDATDEFGFQRYTLVVPKGRPRESLACWNGESFDFIAKGSGEEQTRVLFGQYGENLVKVNGIVGEMIQRLDAVYERHRLGEAWDTPEEMLRALGLYEATQIDGYTYFRDRDVDDAFLLEMSDGISRANYGQSTAINALAAMVSLAGGGAGGGYLYSVFGGNAHLFKRMIERSGADLYLKTSVAGIEASTSAALGNAAYVVRAQDGSAFPCDAVVIATPLEFADIRFSGIHVPDEAKDKRAFQVTHTTFVAGRPNSAYFGLAPDQIIPDVVLTRENPEIPFSSIGLAGETDDGALPVYKLFSREELEDETLDTLFTERADTLRLVWKAYPVLQPMAKWPPFRLGPGLYYVNAMESAVSTMETEAIAAQTVVNLMARDMLI